MGASALTLSACSGGPRGPRVDQMGNEIIDVPEPWASYYRTLGNEPHPVLAVDLRRVPQQFWRQEVTYVTDYAPGTIVVDTPNRFLYLIGPNNTATRYGVGVGRDEALQFKGNAVIGRKAEWPRWTPTANMVKRDPDRYAKYAAGMEGGETNPLGARALYLFRNGGDSHFRLHGTTEPYTIGTNVSSGCIRLMNQDIIDLYSRVPTGTKVYVLN